jgi:hypothetical protein
MSKPLSEGDPRHSQFLVPPKGRVTFVLVFSTASAIAFFFADWIVSRIDPFLPPPLTIASPTSGGGSFFDVFLGLDRFLNPYSSAISGAITGTIIGMVQGLLLRRYRVNLWLWMGLSALGSSLYSGLFALWLFIAKIPAIIKPFSSEFVCSFTIGLAQWLYLRRIVKLAIAWGSLYPLAKLLGFASERGLVAIAKTFDNAQLQVVTVSSRYLGAVLFWGIVPAIALCFFSRRKISNVDDY